MARYKLLLVDNEFLLVDTVEETQGSWTHYVNKKPCTVIACTNANKLRDIPLIANTKEELFKMCKEAETKYSKEQVIDSMFRFASYCNEQILPSQTLHKTAVDYFSRYVELLVLEVFCEIEAVTFRTKRAFDGFETFPRITNNTIKILRLLS